MGVDIMGPICRHQDRQLAHTRGTRSIFREMMNLKLLRWSRMAIPKDEVVFEVDEAGAELTRRDKLIKPEQLDLHYGA
jgi:hypothetical protein